MYNIVLPSTAEDDLHDLEEDVRGTGDVTVCDEETSSTYRGKVRGELRKSVHLEITFPEHHQEPRPVIPGTIRGAAPDAEKANSGEFYHRGPSGRPRGDDFTASIPSGMTIHQQMCEKIGFISSFGTGELNPSYTRNKIYVEILDFDQHGACSPQERTGKRS